ncbi:DUF2147 domain-containing protein [Afipia sp. GAS231]|uniref:DUF2147 domain-containing protein n=1 Tax=Afipia sp. GAS231 TaxID=1882747 RepID=UPI00087A2CCF|nr:DUF2147 domain-containing protein [Afipia sp. GAS231]SDN62763.1 hypothetical protein SAMN05444050_2020 [Afipia sp. GAS231]
MKRIYWLAGLMALSSPAYAGSSISFSVGGHRIHIEASPHCRSTSCASVSVSGIYDSRRRRDRFDDDDAAPAKPASPTPQMIAPPAPPANNLPAPTVVVSAPPTVYKPAAVATQIAAAPPPPRPVQQVAIPLAPPPPVQQVAIPVPPPLPAPVAAPQVSRVSHEVEQETDDTPVGDWQTEGKGAVRITRCGNALCGYVLNSSSDDRGEAVLINMKPKDDTQWTGNVYSHDSGDTFYGTMNLKTPNTLRVEACALYRFYCSGNNWSRISGRAESLMTSRQVSAEPRS